jgi:hypothetical protein
MGALNKLLTCSNTYQRGYYARLEIEGKWFREMAGVTGSASLFGVVLR